MNRTIGFVIGVGVAFATVSAADAAGGCGGAYHRGPYGGCRPNLGPGPMVVGGPAVGVFYGGRGWWDGQRYWHNRYRWHEGWRYR